MRERGIAMGRGAGVILMATLIAQPAFATSSQVHAAQPVSSSGKGSSSKPRSPVEMAPGSPVKHAPTVVAHGHGTAHF